MSAEKMMYHDEHLICMNKSKSGNSGGDNLFFFFLLILKGRNASHP